MSGSSKKVIFAALIGNALVALTKFVAAAFTGSSAMFSEGIHSLVDTGNQVLLLHGLRHLTHPVAIHNPLINYAVLSLAMLFEGAAWFFAFKEFSASKGKLGYLKAVQRGKDPTNFVVLFNVKRVFIEARSGNEQVG